MPYPIREYHDDRYYLLTNRTADSVFLLRPGEGLEEIIAGRFIAAAIRYGIEVYGFVALSNHFHTAIRGPKGNIHAFMRDFQAPLARDVNKKRGRRGPFWGRRYSGEEILDPASLERKLLYILANPAAADLTETVHEWPGLSSAPELLENDTRMFLIFDAEAWRVAGKPDDRAPFFKKVPFEHAVLPTIAHLSAEERAKKLAELLAVEEKKHADRRGAEGKGVLGRARILATKWWDRPVETDTSPRPLCHASSDEDYEIYRDRRRDFESDYRAASKRYRSGEKDVKFPPGSFKPWLPRLEDVPNRARAPSVPSG